jgi:hypothetical protein
MCIMLSAGHQARRAAGVQRTLYAVACMPWLDDYLGNVILRSSCLLNFSIQPRRNTLGHERQLSGTVE